VADSYKIGQERTADGSATLLRISGELDFASRDELHDVIVEALDAGDVIVDLADATFLDSEALGALIDGYNAAHTRSVGFRVVNPRGLVARVLQISGTLDLFGS
jgi:anti-sigma B factor antagonist